MKSISNVKFDKESPWSEISLRFCRFHDLPFGSELKIIYTSNPKYVKGRIQRNNTVYSRKKFSKKTHNRAADSENIRTLIDEYLLPNVDLKLKEIGAEIGAFSPEGERLDTKTSIRTWRSMSPKLTEDEIEIENLRDQEINEIAKSTEIFIKNLSEFRWDPEDTVLQGVLRGLINSYTRNVVRDAFQTEF